MSNLSDYFNKIDSVNKLSHSFLIGNVLFNDIKDDLLNCLNKYIFKCETDYDNNPDLYVFTNDESNISKDDIKDLISEISTTSQFNNNKVYIIDEVEKLNVASLNTILKTLEEPEDNVYAFLITKNMNSVLPTIVSRCQKIFISSGKTNEEFDSSIIEIGDLLIKYIEEDGFLSIAKHRDIYNKIEDRNILKEVLKYILSVYFDTLNSFIDNKNEDNFIINNNTIEEISKKILVINDNIFKLEYYLNKNLSIDRLFIEMWRCKNENS